MIYRKLHTKLELVLWRLTHQLLCWGLKLPYDDLRSHLKIVIVRHKLAFNLIRLIFEAVFGIDCN